MRKKAIEYVRNHFNEISIKLKTIPLSFNEDAHQLTNTTSRDRYPKIFSAVRNELESYQSLKILSYGCSTGEECVTLSNYFPASAIVGTDINRQNLKKALQTNRNANINFLYSDLNLLQHEAPFNAIFCMSVLCRWEETKHVKDSEAIYSFEKFERQLHDLDALLGPKGLLVLYNCNFRFSDSALMSKYQPLKVEGLTESGFVHKFDRQNQKISEQYPFCIFRKSQL